MDESLPVLAAPEMSGHVAAEFLSEPALRSHSVQFYENEPFLYQTVARYFEGGLTAGDRLLLVGTPEHAQGILAVLGQERVAAALRSGQLTLVDARQLLDALLVDGMPEPARFRAELKRLLLLTQVFPGARLRAFGEMVHVLCGDGNFSAALRLEELWNEAAQAHEFSLLCAYGLASFREHRDGARFEKLCGLHSHVIPSEGYSQLSDCSSRLREISVLQQRAYALDGEIRQRQAIEAALRQMLAHHTRVEADLLASREREQRARVQAQANDSFKEVFMGILDHELRDPLNTILTTARLMTLRAEPASDSQARLERVVTSGVRMQRMLEQVLDMARDRLATGISVSRSPARDLVPLVAKRVEELRQAHPQQRFELLSEGSCLASVDVDRFEQVLSNLLDNAVTHGDATRPVLVRMTSRGDDVSLSVRNHGRPIALDQLPLLFDPLLRARKSEGSSQGLGLGLYISERILRAHGGALRVESSHERGTLFEATFPRSARLDGSS